MIKLLIILVGGVIGVVGAIRLRSARRDTYQRLEQVRPDPPVLHAAVMQDGDAVSPEKLGVLSLYQDELIFLRRAGEPVRIARAAIVDSQKVRSGASFGDDGSFYGEGRIPEYSLRIDWKDATGAHSMIWAMKEPMPWLRALLA